jgi:hypothetical protein
MILLISEISRISGVRHRHPARRLFGVRKKKEQKDVDPWSEISNNTQFSKHMRWPDVWQS